MVRTPEEVQKEVNAALEEVKTWFFETYVSGHFQYVCEYNKDVLSVQWTIQFIPSDWCFVKQIGGVYTDKMRCDPYWDDQTNFAKLVPKYKRAIMEAMYGANPSNCT